MAKSKSATAAPATHAATFEDEFELQGVSLVPPRLTEAGARKGQPHVKLGVKHSRSQDGLLDFLKATPGAQIEARISTSPDPDSGVVPEELWRGIVTWKKVTLYGPRDRDQEMGQSFGVLGFQLEAEHEDTAHLLGLVRARANLIERDTYKATILLQAVQPALPFDGGDGGDQADEPE